MFAVAVDGCRLGVGAILALPWLFASAFLVVAALYFLSDNSGAEQASPMLPINGPLLDIIGYIVQNLAIASVLIGVHRFVLLGERIDRFVWTIPPTYPRFATTFFAASCYFIPLIPFVIIPQAEFGSFLYIVGFIYFITGIVIGLRMTLLFPALALGSPLARWRNSWRETRGHVWRIFLTGLLAGLPITIVGVILSASSVAVVSIVRKQGGQIPPWLVLTGSSSWLAAFSLSIASIGAVIASRYFQAYGNALTYPPPTAIPR